MSASQAQEVAPPEVTVVRPSDNGYDELMRAGTIETDQVKFPDHARILEAIYTTTNLGQKRAALNERVFRDAMTTFRDAIGKPIEPPLEKLDLRTRNDGPVYNLGRLLAVEESVFLSEGKTRAALSSFVDSIVFSNILKLGICGV